MQLLEGSRFGERKGAAYGLAGVVKGLGVSSLTQLGIADRLQEAVANKKNYKHREGRDDSRLLDKLCLVRYQSETLWKSPNTVKSSIL